MYPNDPYNQQPQHNNYDFIMNPQKPKRGGLFLPGGNSGGRQLLLIGGAVIVFIILLFVIGSALTSGSDAAAKRLTTLAAQQNEIAHVANVANDGNIDSQTLKNFSQTAEVTMTSDQQTMVDFLANNGVGVSNDQLASLQDPQVNANLQTAIQASSFDSTFKRIIKNMIKNYQQSLKQSYATATSDSTKKLLSNDYDHTTLLLKQLGQKEY
jgi:type II secretory pathway component PulM